jgi:hypothetical protein
LFAQISNKYTTRVPFFETGGAMPDYKLTFCFICFIKILVRRVGLSQQQCGFDGESQNKRVLNQTFASEFFPTQCATARNIT